MAPYVYVEVEGDISDELQSSFPSLAAEATPTGTLLRGPLPDQAALLGVLATVDMMGLRICSAGTGAYRPVSADDQSLDSR